jgi:hypothetical protein
MQRTKTNTLTINNLVRLFRLCRSGKGRAECDRKYRRGTTTARNIKILIVLVGTRSALIDGAEEQCTSSRRGSVSWIFHGHSVTSRSQRARTEALGASERTEVVKDGRICVGLAIQLVALCALIIISCVAGSITNDCCVVE